MDAQQPADRCGEVLRRHRAHDVAHAEIGGHQRLGPHVDDRHAHLRGLGVAGDRHQPRLRLRDEVVAGPAGVGTGLAEAGDRAIDELRIGVLEVLVAEPVFGEVASLEVLDQHVGSKRQSPDDVPAGRRGDVDGHRPLVARDCGPPQAPAVEPEAVAPHDVAIGRLDLDDVGAEIAEQLPGERTGDEGAELEHAHAGQRGVVHGRDDRFRATRRSEWTLPRACGRRSCVSS